MEMTHRQAQRVEVEWASGVNVILGLWLILSPFVFLVTAQPVILWNNVILGIAIAVLAFVRASRPERNPGLSWANVVLGLWVLISPFVLGYSSVTAMLWSDVITGIVVLALAAWSALETGSMMRTGTQP